MNRRLNVVLALALLPIAACSSNKGMTPNTVSNLPAVAAADQAFVNAAATSDADEIQAGQMASTKARSPRVKAFASKMVTDHTAMQQKLAALIQPKGITATPTPPDAAMQAKMAADKGAAFDRDYLHGQVMGHTTAVQAFKDEIANGQDADLKAYATQGLPAVQQHLTLAKRLGGR